MRKQRTDQKKKATALTGAAELYDFLYKACDFLRGPVGHESFKDYITPLLYYKRLSDVWDEEYRNALEESDGDEEYARLPEQHLFDIPEGCHWDEIRQRDENLGSAIVEALHLIEQANPDRVVGNRVVEGLGGIFGKRDHWTNKNILSDQTLSELVEHFSKFDLSIAACPADEMGQAYEYLVGKFADDAGNTAQEFYTNRTVVELMAEILEPRAGESIYDPTCGTGGMLISCIARCKRHEENWREIKAYGQEQNALTSSVARMNLFLHGVEEFRIVNDDTLLRPGFLEAGKLKTFDVVLANPPYSIKKWNRELFSNDPFGRNFLGTPPQGRADYAFIQHILKSMDPKTGRCAILLPHGVLFRKEEEHIRKALVESDLLETVIGLAPNLFYNSPMEACVMICRAKKPAESKGRVFFVNAVNEVTRKNAESKLESRHIEKILQTCRKRTSDGVFAYDATNEEIAANGYSLSISLYAHQSILSSEECDSGKFEDALAAFENASCDAENSLVSLSDAISGKQKAAVRKGKPLAVAPGRDFETQTVKLGDVAEEIRETWTDGTSDVPVVGLEHLEPDELWLRHWDLNPTENTFTKAFRKGQMLFGRRRAYQKKLSLAPCDGICSGDITVIAAKNKKILPELLPFYLRSDKFFDYAMKGSGGSLSPRVKWAHLADYEFDLPPIERQKELAELLWAANDLKEKYKRMIAASDEMLQAKFREMFGDAKEPKFPVVELATVCTGEGEYGIAASADLYNDAKGRYVRITDITDDGELNDDCVSPSVFDERYLLRHGDLLFARTGNTVGKTYMHKSGYATFAGYLIRYVPDSSQVRPDFLFQYTRTKSYLDWVENAKKIGAQPNISAGQYNKMPIILPPIALQNRYMAIAEKADETKAALKKSIADVDAVMRGLING